jgi:hypothetical protein
MATEIDIRRPANELLMQAADDLGGDSIGKILKFTKGHYYIGDEEIAVNSEMIAHITQLARGWVKFKGGELTDRRIGKVVEGFVVPQREELDDTDQTNWEKNDRNQPKDPWVLQTYLPFERPETSQLLVFVTGSAGGRGAVANLVRTASNNLHKGQPVIQLGVRSYKHKQFGRIENPDFPIVAWTGGPVFPAATNKCCASGESSGI